MLSSRLGCKNEQQERGAFLPLFHFPVTTPLLVYVQTGRQDQFLSLPLSHARSGRGGGRRRRPGQKAPAFAASEWEEKRRKEEEKLERFSAKFLFFFQTKNQEGEYLSHTHTHNPPF